MVHTDHKVLLYTLQVTSNMLQITRYILTDYKDTRFSLQPPDFIRWWQYYAEVNIVKPPKNSSQNGRPSFTVTEFVIHVKGYRLAGCILKPAA